MMKNIMDENLENSEKENKGDCNDVLDCMADELFESIHANIVENAYEFANSIKEQWKSLVKIELCRILLERYKAKVFWGNQKEGKISNDSKLFKEQSYTLIQIIQEANNSIGNPKLQVLKKILKDVRKESGTIIVTSSQSDDNGGNTSWHVIMKRFLKKFQVNDKIFTNCEIIACLWSIISVIDEETLKEMYDGEDEEFRKNIESLLQFKNYRNGKRINEALDFLYDTVASNDILPRIDIDYYVLLLDFFQYHDHMIEKMIFEKLVDTDNEKESPWKVNYTNSNLSEDEEREIDNQIGAQVIECYEVLLLLNVVIQNCIPDDCKTTLKDLRNTTEWVHSTKVKNSGNYDAYSVLFNSTKSNHGVKNIRDAFTTIPKVGILARDFENLVHGYASYHMSESKVRELQYMMYNCFPDYNEEMKEIENLCETNDGNLEKCWKDGFKVRKKEIYQKMNVIIADIILKMGIKKKKYYEIAEIDLFLRLFIHIINSKVINSKGDIDKVIEMIMKLGPHYFGENTVWDKYEKRIPELISEVEKVFESCGWTEETYSNVFQYLPEILLESIEPHKKHLQRQDMSFY